MGKRFTGPDWTDVALTMKAIETTHACTAYVHLEGDSYSASGGLQVTVWVMSWAPSEEMSPRTAALRRLWPNADGRDLPSSVYGMLVQLDAVVGRTWYRQETMIEP